MSALAHHYPIPASRPHLRLVPPPAEPSVSITPASVYRRRRIVVLALFVISSVVFVLGARAGTQWVWQQVHHSTSPAMTSASPSAPAHTWTVRPGDTIWGIAQSLQPTGDVRPLVAKLSEAYKGQPLVAGMTLTVPN